jgi:choline dehydrogenase-like flavoprotein
MKVDGRQLPHKHTLFADVCIIGGGAAGITIAHELKESGLSIIIVESGGERKDQQVQSLSAGEVSSESLHPPVHMYRERLLGGSSTIWGGRCVPFDEIDFETRDHIPFSGWPVSYHELQPFYERALWYCEAGDNDFSVGAVGSDHPFIEGYDEKVFEVGIERYSPPTNFGRRYGPALFHAPRLTVVLNATCVELIPAAQGDAIASARFATFASNEFEIKSTFYVIATGGLEVVRLLAASRRNSSAGVANSSGMLGRFYMCHIEGTFGALQLSPSSRPVVWNFERTKDGVYARRKLRLKDTQQRNHRTLNMIFRLHHANPVDPRHQNSILSLMYLSKRFILPEYRRKITTVELSELGKLPQGQALLVSHLLNVARDTPSLMKFIFKWIYARHAAYHRIPYVALHSPNGRYPLDFNSEQTPNPASQVSLTHDLDFFGVPQLHVEWRRSSDDIQSIAKTYRLLRSSLEAAQLGTVEFEDETLEERLSECGPVGGHHIGTARMSSNPKLGVVDEHCRAHDLENLYVASSAVFPTCGHANPTLTILALSVRIAQELQHRSALSRHRVTAFG